MIKKWLVCLLLIVSLFVLLACVPKNTKQVITPDELWNNKEAYFGKEVLVKGTVEQLSTRCSAVVCTKDNPCCQGCASKLGFVISNEANLFSPDGTELPFSGDFNGKLIGCQGTNCELTCNLFEPKKNYTLGVILSKTKFSEYYLNLTDVPR